MLGAWQNITVAIIAGAMVTYTITVKFQAMEVAENDIKGGSCKTV